MALRLWRIATGPHPLWSGEGARLFGQRWNPPGLPAIYCGTSFAICLLEVLVHANRKAPPTAAPSRPSSTGAEEEALTVCTHACSHACMSPTGAQPRLPLPPTPQEAEAAAGKEPLQVRIPVGIKRRFKAHAAMHGMEPNELFVEVWRFYEREHAKGSGGEV